MAPGGSEPALVLGCPVADAGTFRRPWLPDVTAMSEATPTTAIKMAAMATSLVRRVPVMSWPACSGDRRGAIWWPRLPAVLEWHLEGLQDGGDRPVQAGNDEKLEEGRLVIEGEASG